MSSFSSPPTKLPFHSSTAFKSRMAARKRANLEIERKQQIHSRQQTKRLSISRRASQLRLKEIQKERENLRNMLDNTENTKYTARNTTTTTTTTTATTRLKTNKTTARIKRLPLLNRRLKSNWRRNTDRTTSASTSTTTATFTSTATPTPNFHPAPTSASAALSQRPADLSSPGNHRNYKKVRNLGRGSFGAVTAARHLVDGKIYAIKAIAYRGVSTVSKDRERALKEVKTLKLLSDHPCIVGLKDAFESKNLSKLYIVAEFCESGTLHERLVSAKRVVERNGWDSGRLEPKLVGSWIFQLAAAVEHLHSRNILHRDIKPANIFLCAGATQVKLGDFGLVGVLENSMDVAKSHVGTPMYNMTPELLTTGGVSKPADMWSMGCIIHECLTLEQPYTQKGRGMTSIVKLGQSILNTKIDGHPRLLSYPLGLRTICSHECCMSQNPLERPTASALLESSIMLKIMKMYLSTKHIIPPPFDLIQLVKSKVLLGEAAKVVEDLHGVKLSEGKV